MSWKLPVVSKVFQPIQKACLLAGYVTSSGRRRTMAARQEEHKVSADAEDNQRMALKGFFLDGRDVFSLLPHGFGKSLI